MSLAQRTSLFAAILLLFLLSPPAWAQDAPPLRVTASAPLQALADGTIELQLEVMTSTWFTQPPRLPTLTLPGVLVTPPSGEGVLLREQKDGVAYSGLRYTYLLIATQPGSLLIPALTVSAQVGPGRNVVSASSAPLAITVAVAPGASQATPTGTRAASRAQERRSGPGGTRGAPDATASAATSSPASFAIVARSVSVTQEYALAPDPLVMGGRITRTVTQRAEGAQAMSLAAAPMGDVPHFKRYPLEPEVTTLTDGRGNFVGGQRIDRVQYVAQDAGTFEFPTLTLPWRDAADGAMRENTAPGRTVKVGMAPAPDVPFSLADDLARLRQDARWVLPPGVLKAAAITVPALLLLWLTWPWWRRGVAALRAALRRAQARWCASEAFYWRAWQRASRRAPATLSAFYLWLHRCTGMTTLRDAVMPMAAASRSQAEMILRQIHGLHSEDSIDGKVAGQTSGGNLSQLAAATRTWRKSWRRRAKRPSAYALPSTLAASSSKTNKPAGSAP
ncbi:MULTISPECIES: BatD family protein [unclassified Achromobacter]|uniref:BatD family protein n=1 Tax=unclassified Achromobacter TaxID=2626865 RepID=UPI000B51A5F0|nr:MULTISPECIES: BatD family protein [unclassified Achromobacter]OWT80140.1 hypothetical protein CEY05_01565 [Achromobacter sp. HZ34]OWT82023.1 hypothetical protein CEY04_01565 [Achromobacter sp. HZ28]